MGSPVNKNTTPRHTQSRAWWQKSKAILQKIVPKKLTTKRTVKPLPDLPSDIIEQIISHLSPPTSRHSLPASIKAVRLAHPILAEMTDRQFPSIPGHIAENLLRRQLKNGASIADDDLIRAVRRTSVLKVSRQNYNSARDHVFWGTKASFMSGIFEHAQHVETLDFSMCHMTADMLRPLVSKPYTSLHHVDLAYNDLFATGFHRLHWQHPEALKTLGLDSCKLGDRGANLPLNKMNNLRCFSIASNLIGPKGVTSLSFEDAPALRHLFLNDNPLGDEGAQNLKTDQIPNLLTLNVAYTQLTGQGITNLGLSSLENLTYLHLSGNRLGSVGMQALKDANLPHLKLLRICKAGLDADSLEYLSWPNIGSLRILDINLNKLTGTDLIRLPSAHLHNLVKLEICGNPLGSGGFNFMTLNTFSNLNILLATSCELGAAGAESLPIENLPNLTFANFMYNDIPIENRMSLFARSGRKNLIIYSTITSLLFGEATK